MNYKKIKIVKTTQDIVILGGKRKNNLKFFGTLSPHLSCMRPVDSASF
jgi:hypothetical protein